MENQSQERRAATGSTQNPKIEEAKEEVKQVASQVQQKAAATAEQAKHQVKEVAHQVEQEAKLSLSTHKAQAADELHSVAEALRQTSSQLRQQDQSMFAEYGNRMANQVEHLSTYLEDHDVDDLVHEAEDFARRQPELFLGGAFTLGLIAARFLKSSAPGRRYQTTTYPPTPRYPETGVTPRTTPGSDYPFTATPETTRARVRAEG